VVKEYFQELLESLFNSTSELDVEIVNKIEDISIPTKTAISLGLVVNEIATNAMKYGFTSDEEARFTIEMTRDSKNTQYILTLSNTGHPFSDDIGLENPETMGLQLVSTLVRQINGTIELQKKPSPVFTIRFPLGEE
jgi:two-component sensor histidine kinase